MGGTQSDFSENWKFPDVFTYEICSKSSLIHLLERKDVLPSSFVGGTGKAFVDTTKSDFPLQIGEEERCDIQRVRLLPRNLTWGETFRCQDRAIVFFLCFLDEGTKSFCFVRHRETGLVVLMRTCSVFPYEFEEERSRFDLVRLPPVVLVLVCFHLPLPDAMSFGLTSKKFYEAFNSSMHWEKRKTEYKKRTEAWELQKAAFVLPKQEEKVFNSLKEEYREITRGEATKPQSRKLAKSHFRPYLHRKVSGLKWRKFAGNQLMEECGDSTARNFLPRKVDVYLNFDTKTHDILLRHQYWYSPLLSSTKSSKLFYCSFNALDVFDCLTKGRNFEISWGGTYQGQISVDSRKFFQFYNQILLQQSW